MFNFQIKERLDFILLCLLLIRHQVLSESTSVDTHSADDEVTWNGWPDTKDVSEITALVDYTTGLIFYKDPSVPACFVENHPQHSHSPRHTPSTLPKVLSVSSKLHRISNSDEWSNSLYKEQFCGPLPIFKIQALDEKKLKRLPRKKRQVGGGGSQAQASQWPSSSQTQVQGSVSGQGFFSGQAQAAHGGYSQSQVQLGGQGISGNLQSSAGNAQSQLSLGEHGGAGQASSFGHGPSSSQVQVNLGQREQGSHASANVFQQHAYDQGEYSKQLGNGYSGTGRQRDGQKFSTYPASGYGNGQPQVAPQDYRQGGSTFTGQPLATHGTGRNGYYSPPQYSPQPQHTSYSNGRSSAQLPKTVPGYDSQGLAGQGVPSVGTGHGQALAPGSGYDGGVPLSGGQQGGFGQGIPPIQVQPPQSLPGTGYGTTGAQQFPSGGGIATNGNGRGVQSLAPGTGLTGVSGQQGTQQSFYTQQQPQLGGGHTYPQHAPATSSLGTQDHGAGQRSYDSYSSTAGRDTGRQSQNQGVYIDSNVQPLNGHGVGQQSTQNGHNGDHRRRHGNGAYGRGGSYPYGASAGAGTGYGAYASAPGGGQAQAQSLHIGSLGLGTNGKTPYYSTAPQGQVAKVPAGTSQDGSHVGNGYTNGYTQPSGQRVQDQGRGNGHAVDQRQPSQTNGIIDQEHHARQNGNGHHGITQQQLVTTNGNGHHGITQQQPVRTNGNGHHGITQQQPVRTNGNGHHGITQQQPVRTNGNGHHTVSQQPTRTNGNGHHEIPQQPIRTNGNGHHGITQQQPVRTNGNGYHVTQQQPVRTNGNGHHGTNGYGTPSTTYTNGHGKATNGYRNGNSISVNGYSSGNGRITNGYVPAHQQPQYTHRQSGSNGALSYGNGGTASPLKPQPQCTVITFTCTIVIESNGRAKLCRPKSTNGGSNGNTGVNTDQTVCCC